MNYVNKVYSEKLLSYLPLYVIDAAKNSEAYLAGGALTSLFTDSKINDFDFYFKDGNKCADFIESIQGSAVVLQVTKRSITLKENDIVICGPNEMGVFGQDLAKDADNVLQYISQFKSDLINVENFRKETGKTRSLFKQHLDWEKKKKKMT